MDTITANAVEINEEKHYGERTSKIENLNLLLGDFQHTILQSIIESAESLTKEEEKFRNFLNKIHLYIKRRGTYLDELAKFITSTERHTTVSADSVTYKKLKNEIKETVLFADKLQEGNNINDKIKKWQEMFVIEEDQKNKGVEIKGVCWGPIQTILENLITNSIDRGKVADKNGKIYILFSKINSYPAIFYWDTGKGFDESYKNISRWYKDGPTSDEERKGYGYWLIGRIMEHIGAELKLLGYNKIDSSVMEYEDKNGLWFSSHQSCLNDNLGLTILENNNSIRIVHILVFKNEYWQKGGRVL